MSVERRPLHENLASYEETFKGSNQYDIMIIIVVIIIIIIVVIINNVLL